MDQLLVNLFEQDYSLLLFYSIFILIEIRMILLLSMKISCTEDAIYDLQNQCSLHETKHDTYCLEMEKKLAKYNFIDNHNEIRNLRSSAKKKVNE